MENGENDNDPYITEISEEEFIKAMVSLIIKDIQSVKRIAKALPEKEINFLTTGSVESLYPLLDSLDANLKRWASYVAQKMAGEPLTFLNRNGLPAFVGEESQKKKNSRVGIA